MGFFLVYGIFTYGYIRLTNKKSFTKIKKVRFYIFMTTASLEKKHTRGISTKFQMVIPRKIREKYHITPHTLFSFEETERGILVIPTHDPIEKYAGILKNSLQKSSLELIQEERKEEKEREEKFLSEYSSSSFSSL